MDSGAEPDIPKVPHSRRGSVCDRRCSAINNLQAVSPPSRCRRHRGTPAPRAGHTTDTNKLCSTCGFGFQKQKSHVTKQSDTVREPDSNLGVTQGYEGSTLCCGNVVYLLLFGWWLSLLHVLVAAAMFVTVVGAPHGRLCWDLAGYFLWPFGKVVQKVEVPKSHQASEAGAGESSALLGGPTPHRWGGAGHWQRAGTAAWLCLGFPLLALAHGLVCGTAWLLVLLIPVAQLSAHTATHVLLLPPQRVLVRRLGTTEVPQEGEVILCCPRAASPSCCRYSVHGVSVLAINLLPLVVVTLVLGYVDSHNHLSSSAVKFTLALLSITPLSYCIGVATASISAQTRPAVGAVLGATLGSVTQLTFYISALAKGSPCHAELVKSALTGTLLGCVLFIPGLCMVIGGIRHQEQRFNSRSAGVSSALLFLCVGGVFAPTLFSKVCGDLVCGECHDVAPSPPGHLLCHSCHWDLVDNNSTLYSRHVQPLVYTVSLLLPVSYLVWLFFTLKTHSHIYDIHVPGHPRGPAVPWSRWQALLTLLLSALGVSACANLATEHLGPILGTSTISQYFIGVTVLAMVPELPEIVSGIQFALHNHLSLSIEIGNCIAVQVCTLQIPILVLFTIFYPTDFTLLFSDLHVYACTLSVVLLNYTLMDGKCDYFQGTVLVMVYFLLLAVYFFAPSPSGC